METPPLERQRNKQPMGTQHRGSSLSDAGGTQEVELFISGYVLEGQRLFGDSSRNKGEDRCHFPPSPPVRPSGTDIYHPTCLHHRPAFPASTHPAPPAGPASVPTLQGLPQRTSSSQSLLSRIPPPCTLQICPLQPWFQASRSPPPEDQWGSLAKAARPAPFALQIHTPPICSWPEPIQSSTTGLEVCEQPQRGPAPLPAPGRGKDNHSHQCDCSSSSGMGAGDWSDCGPSPPKQAAQETTQGKLRASACHRHLV